MQQQLWEGPDDKSQEQNEVASLPSNWAISQSSSHKTSTTSELCSYSRSRKISQFHTLHRMSKGIKSQQGDALVCHSFEAELLRPWNSAKHPKVAHMSPGWHQRLPWSAWCLHHVWMYAIADAHQSRVPNPGVRWQSLMGAGLEDPPSRWMSTNQNVWTTVRPRLKSYASLRWAVVHKKFKASEAPVAVI